MLEPLYRAVGPDAAAAYTDPTTFSPRTEGRRDGVASGRLSSRLADQRGR